MIKFLLIANRDLIGTNGWARWLGLSLVLGLSATPAFAAGVKLEGISDREVKKIESGLGCSFARGSQYFLFSNTGQALIKPDGKLILQRLDQAKAMRLINGGGTFQIGGYTVTVTTNPKRVSQFEGGPSLDARLSVKKNGQMTTLSGAWACGE